MQLHKVSVASISFKVLESNEDLSPKTVQRNLDQKVFTIGDYVTNGTKMKGSITGFQLYKGEGDENLKMYVDHTWSGVGMNLDSLQKIEKLPSRFQIGEYVSVRFKPYFVIDKAEVLRVHFSHNKVMYDLQVYIGEPTTAERLGYGTTTRIYNVDSLIVEPV